MPQDNIPSQTERAFRERLLTFDRRLKELERRLSGLGLGRQVPVGDSSVEHFHTAALDLSVPSGAFPQATSPTLFVPTRDCSFGIGLLRLQAAISAVGNFDHGCNVTINRGDGWFIICSIGQEAPTNFGNVFTADPSGILPYPILAGQEYLIRHEFYFADSGGLGGSAAMESIFTLVAYPDIN